MRAGQAVQPGALAEWLAAVRGLRDNPVRNYLRAAQRARKRPLWFYWSALSLLVCGLALVVLARFLVNLYINNNPGSSPASYWQQFLIDSPINVAWCLPLLIVLWWIQGLSCWVGDALSLFSFDLKQAQSLPQEFATCPLRDSAIVTGALSVLLPPVLWRIAVMVLACYIIVPWPLLSAFVWGSTDFGWPENAQYLTWAVPAGTLSLILTGSLSALTLTCLLLTAGHRGLNLGLRNACALGLPVIQLWCTLRINANFQENFFWFLRYYPDPLHLIVLLLALLVYGVLYALVSCSLARQWVKSALALALPLLPLLVGLLAVLVMAGIGIRDALAFPNSPPAMWAGGFFVLLNPQVVPEPACLLAAPAWSPVMPEEFFPPGSSYRTRDAASMTGSQEFRRIYTVWHWGWLLNLALQLALCAIALGAARRAAEQWRRAA